MRADDDIACRIEDRKHVIAKAMFRNGHLPSDFQRIWTALIFDFSVESRKKSFGEFGEVRVGALERAPPKNKIGDQGENNQNERQHGRIPKGEPDTNGIKHGSSGRE